MMEIDKKNNVLDNDEKIRTFSKIKSDLDIKEIIKKKLQHLKRNDRMIEWQKKVINIADKIYDIKIWFWRIFYKLWILIFLKYFPNIQSPKILNRFIIQ